jgi:hypothetical protein
MLPLASRGVELYVHMWGRGHREVREIEEWRGDNFCRNFSESRLLVTNKESLRQLHGMGGL